MSALTLALDEYLRLHPDVRSRFDAWLDAEHLTDKHIVELSLGEGCVHVLRSLIVGRELVTTPAVYPVSSLPPADAFTP